MNKRQIIIFVFLSVCMVVLGYALLDLIDRHNSLFLVLLVGCTLLLDILLLAGLFLRYFNSSPRDNQ